MTCLNINGTYCMDTGLPLRARIARNGKNEMCVGRGPGVDMFDSTRIIGRGNSRGKRTLVCDEGNRWSVDHRHSFIDMSNLTLLCQTGLHCVLARLLWAMLLPQEPRMALECLTSYSPRPPNPFGTPFQI